MAHGLLRSTFMNELRLTTPDSLRLELADEGRTARRMRWAHRIASLGLLAAYLYATMGLKRADAIYLLLLAGAVVVFATQIISWQRFRFPEALMRALPDAESERGLRASLDTLWPEIRARYGQRIVDLETETDNREAASRLTLDTALLILRHTHRANWPRFARRWSWGLGLALGLVVSACILHVPNVP